MLRHSRRLANDTRVSCRGEPASLHVANAGDGWTWAYQTPSTGRANEGRTCTRMMEAWAEGGGGNSNGNVLAM